MGRVRETLHDVLRQTDAVLLALCVASTLYGMVLIASATSFRGTLKYVAVQGLGLLIGLVLYFFLSSIDVFELAKQWKWLLGFNVGFLLLLDTVVPHLHGDEAEGAPSRLSRSAMLALAVTLHNIPEGMAVGVVLAAMLEGSAAVTPAAALALSAGIAIQNFPEGAIVAAPLAASGLSRRKAFGYGVVSGAVEPAAAVLTLLLTGLIRPALPYLLAFAAGAMIYVVVEELIPESQAGAHSNIGTVGAALGFALMMALDVALG